MNALSSHSGAWLIAAPVVIACVTYGLTPLELVMRIVYESAPEAPLSAS